MLIDFAIPGVLIKNGNLKSEYIPLLKLEDSIFARKLKEIKQIKLDLDIARSLFININRLADCEENYFLKYSLWFSGAVMYNRCFSPGGGRGTTLNEKKYINNLEEKFILAHEEIVSQRNKYMAHADVNPYENIAVFGVLDYDVTELVAVSNFFDRVIALNKEKPDLYADLVSKIIEQVAIEEENKSKLLLQQLERITIETENVVYPDRAANKEEMAGFYYNVAMSYCVDKRDYVSGIKYFSKAIEIFPNMWELYWNRAKAYAEIGDFEMQNKDIKKVEELKEKN